MTELTDWVDTWLQARELPRGITRAGLIVAPVESDDDGATLREVRCGRTNGSEPLLVIQVHSADRMTQAHAAQVHAACNRWNVAHRLPRAWVADNGTTLKVVLEASLPETALTEECVRRTGDETVDGAMDFWRWADLHAEW